VNWESFFLFCFLFGFFFSVVSFLAGALQWHLPIKGHLGGHPHVSGHGANAAGGNGTQQGEAVWLHISPYNAMTITAFICWFGGAGYLMTHYTSVLMPIAIAVAILVGLLGGAIVFWFLAKFLMKEDYRLDPADFEMVGVIGRLSIPIREGGTGELIYEQAGTRRVVAARNESGSAVAKGEEVVVTRYERGIAYVKLWKEFAEEHLSESADERR
jgi:membrane protein implicated in regulation of membrane protease activity